LFCAVTAQIVSAAMATNKSVQSARFFNEDDADGSFFCFAISFSLPF
jgi:hypothetical protein